MLLHISLKQCKQVELTKDETLFMLQNHLINKTYRFIEGILDKHSNPIAIQILSKLNKLNTINNG